MSEHLGRGLTAQPRPETKSVRPMNFSKEMRNGSPRAFTLIEVMVVLIIVATLATVASLMYTNQAEKAKVSEAVNMIGAIIHSEEMQMTCVPTLGYYSASTKEDFLGKGVDLNDAGYFTYQVTTNGGSPATFFRITARATQSYRNNPEGCSITYEHDATNGSDGEWGCDGNCITGDMLPGGR
jgi:prepilin-type N-terminal cleavage/methylation domain-containing protein